jgi:hypothetical protein
VEHNGFLLDVHSRLTRTSTIALAPEVVSRASAQVVVYEFVPEAVPGLGGSRSPTNCAGFASLSEIEPWSEEQR